MKTMTRVIAVSLVAVMLLLTLVACGSVFGKVKKNFEDAGYTYVSEDEDGNSTAKAIAGELEGGEFNCTFHFFKKDGLLLDKYCMILEFESDKALKDAFSEDGSATLKGLVNDIQESNWVRDNCVIIPLSITEGPEMIEIFNQ